MDILHPCLFCTARYVLEEIHWLHEWIFNISPHDIEWIALTWSFTTQISSITQTLSHCVRQAGTGFDGSNERSQNGGSRTYHKTVLFSAPCNFRKLFDVVFVLIVALPNDIRKLSRSQIIAIHVMCPLRSECIKIMRAYNCSTSEFSIILEGLILHLTPKFD